MSTHWATHPESGRELCCEDVQDWYRQHAPAVRRFTLKATRDPFTAEDCTSETFVRALARRSRFQCQGKGVRPWLVAIARNLVIDQYKRAANRREVCTPYLPDQPDQTATPEQAALRAATASEIKRCLDILPRDQAECIRLRFFAGLSVQETGAAMNRRDNAVRALQYRALRNLKPMVAHLAVAGGRGQHSPETLDGPDGRPCN